MLSISDKILSASAELLGVSTTGVGSSTRVSAGVGLSPAGCSPSGSAGKAGGGGKRSAGTTGWEISTG